MELEGYYRKSDGLTLEISCSPFSGGEDHLVFDGRLHPMTWVTPGRDQPSSTFTIDWQWGSNTRFSLVRDDPNRSETITGILENDTHLFAKVSEPSSENHRVPPLSRGISISLRNMGYYCYHNALPKQIVRQALATADVEKSLVEAQKTGNHTSTSSHDPVILSLFTPLVDVLASMFQVMPSELHRPQNAQIAVMPSQKGRKGLEKAVPEAITPGVHIDGLFTPDNGVEENKLGSFTLVVGVALTDVLESNQGNFAVIPGSHVLLTEAGKRGVEISASRERPMQHTMQEAFGVDFEGLHPVPLCCRKGSMYLALFGTAHMVQRNQSPFPRVAVYFRVTSPKRDWSKGKEARLVPVLDPFSELPGLH